MLSSRHCFDSPFAIARRVFSILCVCERYQSTGAGLGLVADRLERPLSRMEMITLKLDLPILHRTARTARVLEARGQFAQVVASCVKAGDYRDQLSFCPPLGHQPRSLLLWRNPFHLRDRRRTGALRLKLAAGAAGRGTIPWGSGEQSGHASETPIRDLQSVKREVRLRIPPGLLRDYPLKGNCEDRMLGAWPAFS